MAWLTLLKPNTFTEKMPASEAEKKFWICPKLVQKAVLLEANKPAWDNLIRQTVAGWDKEKDFHLVRTSCGEDGKELEGGASRWVPMRDRAQETRIMKSIMDLVAIMKLMNNVPNLLDLLDLICERFPANENESEWQNVAVSCPCHGSHTVALFGFKLLEAIEGALETSQQPVQSAFVHTIGEGAFLEALINRLTRQVDQGVEVVASVKAGYLGFDEEVADKISFLMQHCRVEVRFVKSASFVDMDLDWSGLRRALTSGSGRQEVGTVLAGWKGDAKRANREDLRAVWEAISHSLLISYMWDEVEFKKERGEEGWQALEQFLDTPDQDWQWSGPVSKPMDARSFAKLAKGEEKEAVMQKFGLVEQDLESEEEENEVEEEEEDETGSGK